MILEPGTFNVAEFRKAIPARVKIQVLLNQVKRWFESQPRTSVQTLPTPSWNASEIEFDHNPALTNRPFDTATGDFIPPQNDPDHIEAKHCAVHDQKTFGRAPGALKTVTTRGSDVGERARSQDIRAREALLKARIAHKDGNPELANEILASVKFKKKHTRPKRKIPQRKKIKIATRDNGGQHDESGNERDPPS